RASPPRHSFPTRRSSDLIVLEIDRGFETRRVALKYDTFLFALKQQIDVHFSQDRLLQKVEKPLLLGVVESENSAHVGKLEKIEYGSLLVDETVNPQYILLEIGKQARNSNTITNSVRQINTQSLLSTSIHMSCLVWCLT